MEVVVGAAGPREARAGQQLLFVVQVVWAVGAAGTGGAAAVANVPQQARRRCRGVRQAALAVDGVPAARRARPSSTQQASLLSPQASPNTTTSTATSFLLVQHEAELLELQILLDHLLLSLLQFLQLLQVECYLLAHDAGAVAAKSLPLA